MSTLSTYPTASTTKQPCCEWIEPFPTHPPDTNPRPPLPLLLFGVLTLGYLCYSSPPYYPLPQITLPVSSYLRVSTEHIPHYKLKARSLQARSRRHRLARHSWSLAQHQAQQDLKQELTLWFRNTPLLHTQPYLAPLPMLLGHIPPAHPSYHCLTKAFPNNNLGDGPGQSRRGARASGKRTQVTASNQSSILSHFQSTRPTLSPPAPAQPPLAPSPLPESSTPSVSPQNSVSPIVPAAWARAHPITTTSTASKSHLLFTSDHLGIAIDQATLADLHTVLLSVPLQDQQDPEVLYRVLDPFQLSPAIRKLPADYRTIPDLGYCTPLLIDEILHGTPVGSLYYPPARSRLHQTLTMIANQAQLANRRDLYEAMAQYSNHLTLHPDSATIGSRHWMNADLLLSLLRIIGHEHPIWMQETDLLTPFSPLWMPLSGLTPHGGQVPRTVTSKELRCLAATSPIHIGYANSHHFFARQATIDLPVEVGWMLQNIAGYVLSHPPEFFSQTLPSLEIILPHRITVQCNESLLYIPDKFLPVIEKACKFTPPTDRMDKILSTLNTSQLVTYAHLPPSHLPALIPANGFCSLHTLDFLCRSPDGRTAPPSFPSNRQVQQLIKRISDTTLTTPSSKKLSIMDSKLRTGRLAAQHWPHLNMVTDWANSQSPTAIWLHEDDLPPHWVKLTTIPGGEEGGIHSRSRWTTTDLYTLHSARHIALDNKHFFPTNIPLDSLETMIYTLACRLDEYISTRATNRINHATPEPLHTLTVANPSPPHQPPDPATAPPIEPVPDPIRHVHFPDQTDTTPTVPLCTYSSLPRPLVHPALTLYHPDSDPFNVQDAPTHNYPTRSRAAVTPTADSLLPFPAPTTDNPMFLLKSQQDFTDPDMVLIGPAVAPGSYYAAFARQEIETETDIAQYHNGHSHQNPTTHPSDPTTPSNDYAISIFHAGEWYETDSHLFGSCTARFVDEANTEQDENCRFRVKDGVIWLTSTRPIQRYEQLLTRYGHEYWCDSKWPLSLLRTMFKKYSPTLRSADNAPALAKWKQALTQRATLDRIAACAQSPSILRQPVYTTTPPDHTLTPPTISTLVRNRARDRKKRQQKHRKQVIAGNTQPLRPLPTESAEVSSPPDFVPQDWVHTYPLPNIDTISTETTNDTALLKIMSMSCRGHLFSNGNYINGGIREFLLHITDLMKANQVDIMWLNDGRFTPGMMDVYLPLLQFAIPHCRVFQFPTKYVHTGSRCQSFNRMGGAIAIVTHQWHGYVSNHIPDPTGSGLINAIDITVGQYSFRSINSYLVPTSSNTSHGRATIFSRLTSYIQGHTSPQWAKRLSPLKYQLSYMQHLVNSAEMESRRRRVVLISGDMNRPITHTPGNSYSELNLWRRVNRLAAPMQDTLHHLPHYHTWQSPTERQRNSIIDHAFHTPLSPSTHIHQVGTIHNEITNTLSDHHPIWISLSLTGQLTVPKTWLPQPVLSHPDLSMDNDKEIEAYNTHLHNRLTTSLSQRFRQSPSQRRKPISAHASSSGLAVILSHSVLSVHSRTNGLNKGVKASIGLKCQLPRSSYKNCYSPHQRQLQVYLYFYNNLLRLAFPNGKKRTSTPWTSDNYQHHLSTWISQWKHKHNLTINRINEFSPAAQLPSPTHLEQKSFHSISRAYILAQIGRIRLALHGKRREAMRELTNPEISKRDAMRKQKKLGDLIHELSGRSRGQLDLQSLPCAHHGQITDPVRVQDLLNEYFKDWHAIPQDLDPAAEKLARHPRYWEHLLQYKETGRSQLLQKKSNIPRPLQDSLRRACAIKVTPTVQAELQAAIDAPITFEDFDETLQSISNGGAAGPSGVTANMMKAWDKSIRQLVHQHMDNIWRTRATPKWFKDKLIKLAPKVPGNTELKNMRPISLYEVVRKAWTTIIGKRIHLIWHNNDVLHPRQYGYRLDQGTQMALFSVLNELEDAQHTKRTKHATFWDIRRAFDSIPRNLQKLAWVRLGVPKNVAEWFVELDDGGLSFISSPFYHLNKNIHTPEQLHNKNTHFTQSPQLGFTAERGIGQGESASSLMWTALYDILLEFIDPTNRHLHIAETDLDYTDEDAQLANPSAYADDLATITAGPNAEYMQQVQATWLSAFCAFTGLMIHPAKIKATLLGPIPPKYHKLPMIGPLSHADKTDIIIHDLNWKPISCPIFPSLRTVRYLGVDLELRKMSRSISHELALQEINEHLSHLLIQPGTPGQKIDYIQFKLIPIIMTTATCANWTLAQYRALDVPFSRAYRILLALPARSPDAILYMSKKDMGTGLPRVSDKAQIMKWEALTRCMAIGGAPGQSMDDFINRLPPTTTSTTNLLRTISPPRNKKQEIAWPPGQRYTIRSLVEWLHQSNLSMCCRSEDPTPREEQDRSNKTIADLAEDLRLWPSSIYSEEDNADLPPIRLVATDGSFRVEPRGIFDLLTSEYDLRQHGTGAAGVVFIPPGYKEGGPNIPSAVQISLARPAPGLNAFVWELAAQTIALHFTKYLNPLHLVLTSDCTSAIARTNHALRTRHNQLINARGGAIVAGAHAFASTTHPQRFIHTRGHPERDKKRRDNPTLRDKAMSMADAVADRTKAKLGEKTFPMHRHELKLDDLFTEIIPANNWHLRTTDLDPFPVLADILPFQLQALHRTYCTKRDKQNPTCRWASTSFAFGHSIHPLKNRSYWTASRRSLVAYDWIGHGRNRAKPKQLSDENRAETAKCYLCGDIDSQNHCMLDCPHPSLTPIREQALREQERIIVLSLQATSSAHRKHFIQQFATASWTKSPNIGRIWLGLWNQDTLQQLILPSTHSPMNNQTRQSYIQLSRKLTAPLLAAYYEIQDLLTHTTHPIYHTNNDTYLSANHSNHSPSHTITIPPLLRDILENTHIQSSSDIAPSLLNHLDDTTNISSFSLSNAAFGIPDADGTV